MQEISFSKVLSANNNNGSKQLSIAAERIFQPEVNSSSPHDTSNKIDTISLVQTKPGPVTNSVTQENEKIDKAIVETQGLQAAKERVKEVVAANEKNIEEPQFISKNETAANNSTSKYLPAKSKITKISELKGGEAIYITFIDESRNQSDTINVLIPDYKSQTTKEEKPVDKSDLKFLDIKSPPSNDLTQPAVSFKSEDKVNYAGKPINNPIFFKCSISATNDDFLKLRKKMATATDNDGMISEAKKIFKVMCFSTEQIKNLAYLFLTDQSRYQFFDASYPAVFDHANFNSLSVMLSDAYYINRFKAMLIY